MPTAYSYVLYHTAMISPMSGPVAQLARRYGGNDFVSRISYLHSENQFILLQKHGFSTRVSMPFRIEIRFFLLDLPGFLSHFNRVSFTSSTRFP